ncbi:hypothetical protein NDU88_003779 [Pleurodeles waltl]|uniref:Uncharacterized protein n=1 Tax=Pleurodeles waltl TaxID=8319 RepID=A0AAV7MZK2_PLEWA|nr:hypothetical protein NDU88_003779 [Pleurodeles waltl]
MKRLLLVCRLGTRLEIGDNLTLHKITSDTRRAERARPFWCRLARHQKTRASAGVIDETVAARVPPRYAFGDRGQFNIK